MGYDLSVRKLLQKRLYLLFKHRNQLAGRTGKQDYAFPILFDRNTGCCAVIVIKHRSANRNHRLLFIDRRHIPSGSGEVFLNSAERLLIHLQLKTHQLGYRLFGDVIVGRPKPSCQYDDITSFQRFLQHHRQPTVIVADHRLMKQIDPQRGKPFGQITRMGICDIAKQDLGTDRDNFSIHLQCPSFLSSLPLKTRRVLLF